MKTFSSLCWIVCGLALVMSGCQSTQWFAKKKADPFDKKFGEEEKSSWAFWKKKDSKWSSEPKIVERDAKPKKPVSDKPIQEQVDDALARRQSDKKSKESPRLAKAPSIDDLLRRGAAAESMGDLVAAKASY